MTIPADHPVKEVTASVPDTLKALPVSGKVTTPATEANAEATATWMAAEVGFKGPTTSQDVPLSRWMLPRVVSK
jgi:hypothetical protein